MIKGTSIEAIIEITSIQTSIGFMAERNFVALPVVSASFLIMLKSPATYHGVEHSFKFCLETYA
jgi:CBS domain-containing protein